MLRVSHLGPVQFAALALCIQCLTEHIRQLDTDTEMAGTCCRQLEWQLKRERKNAAAVRQMECGGGADLLSEATHKLCLELAGVLQMHS